MLKVRTFGLAVLLTCLGGVLAYSQPNETLGPWKGYSILGNGHLTAVYSDDRRIADATHARGIQHFYFGDYTADYIFSTAFDLLSQNGAAALLVGTEAIGMKNFFTTETRAQLANGGSKTVLCFVHPSDAAVISLAISGLSGIHEYRFEAVLRKEIKTDRNIALTSLGVQANIAVASWSNGTVLAIVPMRADARAMVNGSSVLVTGRCAATAEQPKSR